MSKFYRVFSFLLGLLGLTHLAFTVVIAESFNLEALWFAGSGIAFVLGGLINITNSRTYINNLKIVSIITNLILLAFSILIITLMIAPQSIAAVLICLATLIGSFYFYKNRK